MNNELKLFPFISNEKLRYSDTDRQGHINNANFSTFLETGRVELLYNPQYISKPNDADFVIAKLVIDYKKEIFWPGVIEIGTAVKHLGKSSITLKQQIYQGDSVCAEAETIIVQVCNVTKKSKALNDTVINQLKKFQ